VNGGGSGNFTAFDLTGYQVLATTPIEDGVTDFVVRPDRGGVYLVGSYEGPMEGRKARRLYISEWDPNSRSVARRLPIEPSRENGSVRM
jgi:hypothetical protein